MQATMASARNKPHTVMREHVPDRVAEFTRLLQSEELMPQAGKPRPFFRRWLAAILALGVITPLVATLLMPGRETGATEVTMYMSPYCGCCGRWAAHLEQSGFQVERRPVEDVAPIRSRCGVPDRLASCHTALVDGYVLEGHVPASDIRRLLEQRPHARGLAAPGMPAGAPGMEGAGREPYEVLLFGRNGRTQVFARH